MNDDTSRLRLRGREDVEWEREIGKDGCGRGMLRGSVGQNETLLR